MKVEIDTRGQMTISAETGLEAYALDKWTDENKGVFDNVNILFDWSLNNENN
jgi:hypothetical protein